jgi:hypothetical protein
MLEVASILLAHINHGKTLLLMDGIPPLGRCQQAATIGNGRQIFATLLVEDRGNSDIT